MIIVITLVFHWCICHQWVHHTKNPYGSPQRKRSMRPRDILPPLILPELLILPPLPTGEATSSSSSSSPKETTSTGAVAGAEVEDIFPPLPLLVSLPVPLDVPPLDPPLDFPLDVPGPLIFPPPQLATPLDILPLHETSKSSSISRVIRPSVGAAVGVSVKAKEKGSIENGSMEKGSTEKVTDSEVT